MAKNVLLKNSKRSERSGRLARRRKTTLAKRTKTVSDQPLEVQPTVNPTTQPKPQPALPTLLVLDLISPQLAMRLPVAKSLQVNMPAGLIKCTKPATDKAGTPATHTHHMDKVVNKSVKRPWIKIPQTGVPCSNVLFLWLIPAHDDIPEVFNIEHIKGGSGGRVIRWWRPTLEAWSCCCIFTGGISVAVSSRPVHLMISFWSAIKPVPLTYDGYPGASDSDGWLDVQFKALAFPVDKRYVGTWRHCGGLVLSLWSPSKKKYV